MSSHSHDWHERRRRAIGASEVAAIMGLSPWQTPLQVWAQKVQGLRTEQTPAMEWGLRLEPAVRARYAEDIAPERVEYVQERVEHPSLPLAATLDGVRVRADGDPWRVVEIKTTSERSAGHWAEGVPDYYIVQVQAQLMCASQRWATIEGADVPLLVGGRDYSVHEVEPSQRAQDRIARAVEAFWREFVETETPPPAQASDADIIAELADDLGTGIRLSDDLADLVVRAQDLRAQERELAAERRQLEAEIKTALGEADASYGLLPDGRCVSWRWQERRGYTVQPSRSRVLRVLKRPPKGVAW